MLASGTAKLYDSSFERNHAPLGPAVSNVFTIELNNTQFRNNTLWCDDDSLFLDWKIVSGVKLFRGVF